MNQERKPSLAEGYEGEMDEMEIAHDIAEFEFLSSLLEE